MATGINGWDIDWKFEGDQIVFVCPRCHKKQSQKLTSEILDWGLTCENTEVCGHGNMHIEFSVNCSGWYKDHGDIPLGQKQDGRQGGYKVEIIAKFGYRWYIFYSHEDVTKATGIYAYCLGSQDDFENELENNGIEFTYDLWEE